MSLTSASVGKVNRYYGVVANGIVEVDPLGTIPPEGADPKWSRDLDLSKRITFENGGRIVRERKTNRPINPCENIGIRGRGHLWRWGPNQAADALVTTDDPQSGGLLFSLIHRKTKEGTRGPLAFPGGFRNVLADGTLEPSGAAALREFCEEALNHIFTKPEHRNAIEAVLDRVKHFVHGMTLHEFVQHGMNVGRIRIAVSNREDVSNPRTVIEVLEVSDSSGNSFTFGDHPLVLRAQDLSDLKELSALRTGPALFRGYVVDPRNTDNAWIETSVHHVHLSRAIVLQGGDDAFDAGWKALPLRENLYASHATILEACLARLARWDETMDPVVSHRAAVALDVVGPRLRRDKRTRNLREGGGFLTGKGDEFCTCGHDGEDAALGKLDLVKYSAEFPEDDYRSVQVYYLTDDGTIKGPRLYYLNDEADVKKGLEDFVMQTRLRIEYGGPPTSIDITQLKNGKITVYKFPGEKKPARGFDGIKKDFLSMAERIGLGPTPLIKIMLYAGTTYRLSFRGVPSKLKSAMKNDAGLKFLQVSTNGFFHYTTSEPPKNPTDFAPVLKRLRSNGVVPPSVNFEFYVENVRPPYVRVFYGYRNEALYSVRAIINTDGYGLFIRVDSDADTIRYGVVGVIYNKDRFLKALSFAGFLERPPTRVQRLTGFLAGEGPNRYPLDASDGVGVWGDTPFRLVRLHDGQTFDSLTKSEQIRHVVQQCMKGGREATFNDAAAVMANYPHQIKVGFDTYTQRESVFCVVKMSQSDFGTLLRRLKTDAGITSPGGLVRSEPINFDDDLERLSEVRLTAKGEDGAAGGDGELVLYLVNGDRTKIALNGAYDRAELKRTVREIGKGTEPMLERIENTVFAFLSSAQAAAVKGVDWVETTSEGVVGSVYNAYLKAARKLTTETTGGVVAANGRDSDTVSGVTKVTAYLVDVEKEVMKVVGAEYATLQSAIAALKPLIVKGAGLVRNATGTVLCGLKGEDDAKGEWFKPSAKDGTQELYDKVVRTASARLSV